MKILIFLVVEMSILLCGKNLLHYITRYLNEFVKGILINSIQKFSSCQHCLCNILNFGARKLFVVVCVNSDNCFFWITNAASVGTWKTLGWVLLAAHINDPAESPISISTACKQLFYQSHFLLLCSSRLLRRLNTV